MNVSQLLNSIVEDYAEEYICEHNNLNIDNYDKFVDDIYNNIISFIDKDNLKRVVRNRLGKRLVKLSNHFTYTANNPNQTMLFDNVKELYNGYHILCFDKLKDDELELCEELVKEIEPDKVKENNRVQIIFDNDNEFHLAISIVHSKNIVSYDFIVKLIDAENGVYDIEWI